MKTELINKLEELLLKDAGEVAFEVRALQKEYQKNQTLELEKAKQTFIDEGGRAGEFEFAKTEQDLQFDALIQKHSHLKKESEAKIASDQLKNLIIRQEIISKIKDLSQVSDNIGSAVKMLGELQKRWKETGAVSSHKYKDIQSEYSKAIEDIYYNLKIFRDLQEHDLKKNFELKLTLIEKLRAIQQLENIKEAERLVKIYRNEWEEIGPVPNIKWEVLKKDYKSVLEETYTKIKSHYQTIEEQKEVNFKSKQEIIQKTKELLATLDGQKIGKWNEATDKLLAMQAEWKHVGRTNEKDNEKVWTEFRTLCDEFFEKKKGFYSELNEKFAANRKIKSELITKAESLQHSNDWQKTGSELIRLQDDWKKHSGNGDKEEPKLFARFRKACNTFFDARKQHFEDINASYEKNLVVKEEILTGINSFQLGEDGKLNREQLKTFSSAWNNAGLVPIKDKKRLNDAFYNRLDELYDQMHIDKKEKMQIQFNTKLERMLASDNAMELLRKESEHLKKMIDEINGRVRTYDNNLGFFKSSTKGSNSFMKEIEDKVAAEKNKMAEIAELRKMVNLEMGKLRENSQVKVES